MLDLVIIGAGINGAGIARDAAMRGLSVLICDQGDIAGGTSSASTKLIHGGLRYLERYEFALVREALREREVLRRIAPHLTRPLRFVIPHTPALRPAWMLRSGLALYDLLAGRHGLDRAEALALRGSPYGEPLDPRFSRGFAYSDLQVDDARLTLANVRAAADCGAQVLTRTRFVEAQRDREGWRVRLQPGEGSMLSVRARTLVNAAGPWVQAVRREAAGISVDAGESVRLVKGSHIVLPRLYAREHAYLLQADDGRVVFAIPYEGDYTLIGTTEVALASLDGAGACSEEEAAYLCRTVTRFLRDPVEPGQRVWSYAGVRALYDDGRVDPSAVTREYRLVLDGRPGEPPLLSVFGGKLTTYRRLAQRAVDALAPWLPAGGACLTAEAPLPGGDRRPALAAYAALPASLLAALSRRHGSLIDHVLGEARDVADLGATYGGGLYEREVGWFIRREWARDSEDVLWRRTKCGLRMSAAQRAAFREAFPALLARYAAVERPISRASPALLRD